MVHILSWLIVTLSGALVSIPSLVIDTHQWKPPKDMEPGLPGFQGTLFGHIILVPEASEYVNNLMRYISRLPGLVDVILVSGKDLRKIAGLDSVASMSPGDLSERQPGFIENIRRFFMYLGVEATIAHFTHGKDILLQPETGSSATPWNTMIVIESETLESLGSTVLMGICKGPAGICKGPVEKWLIPVLIIPPVQLTSPHGLGSVVRKILCPVHPLSNPRQISACIERLPESTEVLLLGAISPFQDQRPRGPSFHEVEDRLTGLSVSLGGEARKIRVMVRAGIWSEEIRHVAEEENVSMILITCNGQVAWTADYPSPPALARACLCPVLLVPMVANKEIPR